MKSVIMAGKAGALIAWLWSAWCLASPGVWPWQGLGIMVFWALLLSHAIETVYFYPLARKSPRPAYLECAMFMLFGFFHFLQLKEEGLVE